MKSYVLRGNFLAGDLSLPPTWENSRRK